MVIGVEVEYKHNGLTKRKQAEKYKDSKGNIIYFDF